MANRSHASAHTRRKISTAATDLFAAHGYEATSLKMVGEAAGVAIGTINHFYDGKPGLAAVVREGITDRFVAMAEEALRASQHDVPDGVRSLLEDCARWIADHPADWLVLHRLPTPGAPDGLFPGERIRQRLAKMLATWARPHITAKVLRPLTPDQLYALILVPCLVTAATTAPAGASEGASDEVPWHEVLAHAALAGISVPEKLGSPATMTKPAQKSRRADAKPEGQTSML